jgi:hypothetical protein
MDPMKRNRKKKTLFHGIHEGGVKVGLNMGQGGGVFSSNFA